MVSCSLIGWPWWYRLTGLGRLVVVLGGRDLITMWDEGPLVVTRDTLRGSSGPNVLWVQVDLPDLTARLVFVLRDGRSSVSSWS